MKKAITLLLLTFFFYHANAQENSRLLDNVLSQLKLNKKDIHEPLYREKVLPNKPSNTLMVIPKYRVNETDEYGNLYLELDAYIIIADNTSGKILYKYIEPNAWTSDAMALWDITIDTGLYQLNENTRAFGIRASYRNGSQPNPSHNTDLSLYIVQNNTLEQILNNYKIDSAGGEWDTKCAGEFEDSTGHIDIDKNKTNGFKNLIVKSKTTYTKSISIKDDCVEKVTHKNSTKILKYNGKTYQ
ncbi:hypothetical protein LUD75_06835 [Epilithonimonas sp. JDS]|uniref:hypothetical protein n=1 Tax=Epilithonimonas sp. JDS TaxID=2902797 RepID=UPI001E603CE5|nr:hypothetical protein [Epilithonimonas sp. JDS]MCD9854413.1 hypothetical protein [Epilithonimonas sp. JDS]